MSANGSGAAAQNPPADGRSVERSRTPKADKKAVPTLRKEVGEKGASRTCWGAHADTGSEKTLPFRLTGTLPGDYDSRASYRYKFTDIPGEGLSLDADSVRAYWVRGGKRHAIAKPGYAVSGGAGGITVEFSDLKKAAPHMAHGDAVVVEYTGRLQPSTNRAGQNGGLVNKATLEYGDDDASGGRGTTEPASTESYTYVLRVLKSAADGGTPLAGAEFTLQDADGRYISPDGTAGKQAAAIPTGKDGTLSVHGIDAGEYTLTEVRAPNGYKVDPGAKSIRIESNAAEMGDRLELSARADGGLKVAGVDANNGIVEVTASDEKNPEQPVEATGGTSSPTKADGTEGKAAATESGLFPKTGYKLADLALLIALAAATGIACAAYVLRRRHRGNGAEKASSDDGDSIR